LIPPARGPRFLYVSACFRYPRALNCLLALCGRCQKVASPLGAWLSSLGKSYTMYEELFRENGLAAGELADWAAADLADIGVKKILMGCEQLCLVSGQQAAVRLEQGARSGGRKRVGDACRGGCRR
jgi:hypothetical protein